MRAIFLLAVGAAALKAPKQTALAVRGGGEPQISRPQKLVCRYASETTLAFGTQPLAGLYA